MPLPPKFYARHAMENGDTIGIDLVDTITGVGLFMRDKDTYIMKRLSPHEAINLAAELIRVAEIVAGP